MLIPPSLPSLSNLSIRGEWLQDNVENPDGLGPVLRTAIESHDTEFRIRLTCYIEPYITEPQMFTRPRRRADAQYYDLPVPIYTNFRMSNVKLTIPTNLLAAIPRLVGLLGKKGISRLYRDVTLLPIENGYAVLYLGDKELVAEKTYAWKTLRIPSTGARFTSFWTNQTAYNPEFYLGVERRVAVQKWMNQIGESIVEWLNQIIHPNPQITPMLAIEDMAAMHLGKTARMDWLLRRNPTMEALRLVDHTLLDAV